jgi:hypothetical protein
MVIPLRVQCSKDFVCNRRQHSSRSRRASLSLGIRFEAGNVIVLRGESPQSSSGRASSSAHSLSWKRGESGSQVQLQTTNAFRQQHGCKWNPQSLKVIATACKVCVSHILALRGVSRSTGDETRQPADFNRVAAPLSLSLPPCTGAQPMGCGQRACCRRLLYRVGALPTVGDPTSHFGRFAGTMWPVSEGGKWGGGKHTEAFNRAIYRASSFYTAPGGSLRVRVS